MGGDAIAITVPGVRAKIVQIGNSQGVRIPRPLLDQAELGADVLLSVSGRAIVITPASAPRSGWAEAFQAMGVAGDDALLDEGTPTEFDETSWRW